MGKPKLIPKNGGARVGFKFGRWIQIDFEGRTKRK